MVGFGGASYVAILDNAAGLTPDVDTTNWAMFTAAIGPAGPTGATGPQGIQGVQGPAGANGADLIVTKDSDQNGITATAMADVSGLTVAVSSGQRLRFHAYLRVTTSATNRAGGVSINGPAASITSYLRREWTSATAVATTMGTAYNTLSGQNSGPGATVVIYEIEGIVKFTAAGTFAIRAEAVGTNGTMNVLEGSWMEYNLQ